METKIIVGINKARARVIRLSSVAIAILRNIGTVTAARPEVEGIKKERGINTVVNNQNRLPTVFARATTISVNRFARPVFCTAPPKTKAPIINQTTWDAKAP